MYARSILKHIVYNQINAKIIRYTRLFMLKSIIQLLPAYTDFLFFYLLNHITTSRLYTFAKFMFLKLINMYHNKINEVRM